MKTILISLVLLLIVLWIPDHILSQSTPGKGTKKEASDGKALFTANKCNTCHSVQEAGITAKTKSKAPDLSGIGAKDDAEFIAKFITKQESQKGKKHPTKFNGSKDDLNALATWLESMKEGTTGKR